MSNLKFQDLTYHLWILPIIVLIWNNYFSKNLSPVKMTFFIISVGTKRETYSSNFFSGWNLQSREFRVSNCLNTNCSGFYEAPPNSSDDMFWCESDKYWQVLVRGVQKRFVTCLPKKVNSYVVIAMTENNGVHRSSKS